MIEGITYDNGLLQISENEKLARKKYDKKLSAQMAYIANGVCCFDKECNNII